MPLVYRSMIPDVTGHQPHVAQDKNSLGVCVSEPPGDHDDMIVIDGDSVLPIRQGMSVSPSPDSLPIHRIPRRLKKNLPQHLGVPSGNNKCVCWLAGDGEFRDGLFAASLMFWTEPEGSATHGVVGPAKRTTLAGYRQALTATQPVWKRLPWPWEDR